MESNIKELIVEKIEDIKFDENQQKYNTIIISSPFNLGDIYEPKKYDELNQEFLELTSTLPENLDNLVEENGFVFIYGVPQQLVHYGYNMNNYFTFKYWISLDINYNDYDQELPHTHLGVLMYHKEGKHSKMHLNTKEVRIPYNGCSHCEGNVKDWGGKKHLMNKIGSAVSDVWKDFYEVIKVQEDPKVEGLQLNFIDINKRTVSIKDNIIPDIVYNRLVELTKFESSTLLKIDFKPKLTNNEPKVLVTKNLPVSVRGDMDKYRNKVLLKDTIKFMNELLEEYPDGLFDLVFADPPYNLDKDYEDWDDTLKDEDYIKWCDEWLTLCAKLLKPNGSLFILNIPKWSIYHARTLSKHLYLKNWIVWDALSVPMGKIMPAHYSLLYYTKSKDNYKFNSLEKIESPEYCLRKSCIKKRKNEGMNNKVPVTEIWSDLHRIKHKKDRDSHPAQLPLKLMERIILMASNEGDLVFDPFCGTGTTAIVSKKLNRDYLTTDISEEYVQIATEGLKQIEVNGRLVRKSVKKEKYAVTKKEVELTAQELAQQLGRKPTVDEFLNHSNFNKEDILKLYGNLEYPLKASIIKI